MQGSTKVPTEYNTFAYVWRARVIGPTYQKMYIGGSGIFENDGEQIEVKASKDTRSPFDILLIGGSPINEPIARYGPFVMNTKEEVYQAIQDYRNGLMGSI